MMNGILMRHNMHNGVVRSMIISRENVLFLAGISPRPSEMIEFVESLDKNSDEFATYHVDSVVAFRMKYCKNEEELRSFAEAEGDNFIGDILAPFPEELYAIAGVESLL